MELPSELRILLPQAITVIRYLGAQPNHQADAGAICTETRLSARALGKAVRNLVTRSYLSIDEAGIYHLTPEGCRAAEAIADAGREDEQPPPSDAPFAVMRRLVAALPGTLPARHPAKLYVGIEPPWHSDGAAGLDGDTPLLVRVEAASAQITPAQYTLDLPPDAPAGPVAFTLVAPASGTARVRVAAFWVSDEDAVQVGGMYVDVPVTDSGQSAPLQAFAAPLALPRRG